MVNGNWLEITSKIIATNATGSGLKIYIKYSDNKWWLKCDGIITTWYNNFNCQYTGIPATRDKSFSVTNGDLTCTYFTYYGSSAATVYTQITISPITKNIPTTVEFITDQW